MKCMKWLHCRRFKTKKKEEKKAAKRGHALKLNTLIRKMSSKMLLRN